MCKYTEHGGRFANIWTSNLNFHKNFKLIYLKLKKWYEENNNNIN